MSLIDCCLASSSTREKSKTLENFWIGIGQLSSGFHSDHLIVVTGIVRPIGEIAITHTYFYWLRAIQVEQASSAEWSGCSWTVSVMIVDQQSARLRAYRSNIERYHSLLKTGLTEFER
jgi:hypothetical protein